MATLERLLQVSLQVAVEVLGDTYRLQIFCIDVRSHGLSELIDDIMPFHAISHG